MEFITFSLYINALLALLTKEGDNKGFFYTHLGYPLNFIFALFIRIRIRIFYFHRKIFAVRFWHVKLFIMILPFSPSLTQCGF